MSLYQNLSATSDNQPTTYARRGEYLGHRCIEPSAPLRPWAPDIMAGAFLVVFMVAAFALAAEFSTILEIVKGGL